MEVKVITSMTRPSSLSSSGGMLCTLMMQATSKRPSDALGLVSAAGLTDLTTQSKGPPLAYTNTNMRRIYRTFS